MNLRVTIHTHVLFHHQCCITPLNGSGLWSVRSVVPGVSALRDAHSLLVFLFRIEVVLFVHKLLLAQGLGIASQANLHSGW